MPPLSLDVPQELIKDPSSWTVEDITVWLQWLGLGEHAEAFVRHGVDGHALLRLAAESAWADVGVIEESQKTVLDFAVEPLRVFRDDSGAGVDTAFALHAVEGPIAGEIIYVGAGGITGGRHSVSNGIVLSENYVSRRHFQICRDENGEYLLQDVGSTTGTFLMVRGELVLENLMVLQLGTTELTVFVDGESCTLVATEGPDKDARAEIRASSEGIFIGREPSNGLCIRDPQISAFHCEVRFNHEQGGFLLDDKYSTNRTWLRLAPDGQQSKQFVLRARDLFKVGSTLFHVVMPALAEADVVAVHGAEADDMQAAVPAHLLAGLRGSAGVRGGGDSSRGGANRSSLLSQEFGDGAAGSAGRPATASRPNTGTRPTADDDAGSHPSSEGSEAPGEANGVRWEPFSEGEPIPRFHPEEYARRLTAARHAMIQQHAASSQRGGASSARRIGAGELDPSQASMVQQRELSSLQQGMRNSRAQTAYTLQQQRSSEDPARRDEDLCKICYDNDIDVVLYPCGHFILCRWCAFKVSDCPVCRQIITHVIRTYKA
eukprot:TRINITY_DN12847_c0_g2_i1.p1 TRINITY_DN12847_c0_g2~~TRINITY_DN12847_c0_g2_i1.p1  ORF type:complete len:547 (-),score=94.39 TRINITY_DN12847_c0_g2_i1:104-1744(-)